MLAKRKWLAFEMVVKLIALKNVFMITQSSKSLTYLLILVLISSIMANLAVYKTQLQHKRKNVFFLQWKRVKEKSLNVEITLFLFDTFISSVPDYGCETS